MEFLWDYFWGGKEYCESGFGVQEVLLVRVGEYWFVDHDCLIGTSRLAKACRVQDRLVRRGLWFEKVLIDCYQPWRFCVHRWNR